MAEKFNISGASLTPRQPVGGTDGKLLSFDSQSHNNRSEAGTNEKVQQAQFALSGTANLTAEQIDKMFRGGREKTLRQTAQDAERLRFLETKSQIMNDIVSGGDTSDEMLDVVMALGSTDFENQASLETAIEREYARKVVNTAVSFTDTMSEIEKVPDAGYQLIDGTQEAVTKAAILKDVMDQKSRQFSDFSMVGKGWDIGKTIFPFLDWYAKQNAVEEAPTSSILLGNNVEEQVEYLWSLPPDEFKTQLEAAVNEINDISTSSAISFMQAVATYSGSDKFLDNAFSVLDVASVVPVARLAGLGKGLLKANLKSGTTVADVAEEIGQTKEYAVERVAKSGLYMENIRNADNLAQDLPSIFDVDKLLDGGTSLGQNKLGKLRASLKANAEKIFSIANSRVGIDRISKEELAVIAAEQEEDLLNTFNHLQDSILDMGSRIVPAEETALNVAQVRVQFGRLNGDLFDSKEGAERFARDFIQLDTEDYSVKQKGSKYYVEVSRNIDETKVRDLELPTQAQTPQMLFRGLRSDSYLVSEEQVGARATATTYAERVGLTVETLADPIRDLSNKAASEVEEILMMNNTYVDPKTGRRGQFFDLGEFEHAFQDKYGRLPTDKQSLAYLNFRQINDLDYMIRDASVVKQKSALGIENITINMPLEGGVKSLEGKIVDTLPTVESDFTRIVVLDDATGSPIVRTTNKQVGKRKILQEYLDDGWKVIQVADQRFQIGDETYGYILVKNYKRNRIGLGNLPYRPGGHVVPRTPHMVKQPKLKRTEDGRTLYLGDTTIAYARSAKQAQEIADALDTARRMVKEGNPNAKEFVETRLPFTSWEKFNKLVSSGRIAADGTIMSTRSGSRTIDNIGTQDYVDITHNEHNLSQQITGKFLGERGAVDVDTLSSEEGAIFKMEEASILRPFQAVNVGINSAISEHVMGDYVLKSTDRYYREFGPLLDMTEKEFKQNAIYHMLNPAFKQNIPREARTAALNFSQAVRNMIGVKTEFSKNIDALKEKIVNFAFDKGGEKGFKLVSERLLPTVNDPTVYFRSVAFHTKLGLFNPKQLFLQSQIVAHVAAIGGVRNAVAGSVGYTFSKALGLTDNAKIIESAGDRISKLGWKKEDFIESHTAMVKSGWHIVGGDAAYRDDYRGTNLYKGTVGRALESGLFFFKNGEQIGRVIAWHSAYRAWRAANPTAKLNRAAKERILVRARDLTSNMTRDQSAWWQRGFYAAPTQFWGFQARVFEQFWGSRLSKKEKLRLFTGISMLYGVPVGMGAAALAVPFNEIIRKWQIESGYDESEMANNPMLETVRDGIVAGVIEMATGSDFDTAPYGAAGLPIIKEMFRGETDPVELFLGASGAISRDIMQSAEPVLQHLWSAVTPDNSDDNLYPVTPELITDALSDVTTVNNAVKLWKAINTGKWLSKNENAASDITTKEALISSISGLNLQDITDTYLKLESVQSVKDHVQSVQQEITKDYKRALRHAQAGDWKLHDEILASIKAKAAVNGLTVQEINRAFRDGYNPEDLDEAMEDALRRHVYERNQRKVQN